MSRMNISLFMPASFEAPPNTMSLLPVETMQLPLNKGISSPCIGMGDQTFDKGLNAHMYVSVAPAMVASM